MEIKKDILERVYKEYKDLETRVNKFNKENEITKASKKGLSNFDNNYTKGIEADSRILETKSEGYHSLKYALFYDYTTFIVNFSSNKAVLQKSFKVYESEDVNCIRGKIFNIDELEQKINNHIYEKEQEAEFEME